MPAKIRVNRSETTGQTPTTTAPADIGEISVNIEDRKVFVRDSTGAAQLVADRISDYSAAAQYLTGDFAIEGGILYRANADVPAPEPFDPAKWDALGNGGGGDLNGAVILAPQAAGRNTVTTVGEPAVEGLVITGDPSQSADLLRVGGTQAGDTGKWAINSLGFPNKRGGSVSWRQTEPTHPFTAIGQPADYDGNSWVLGDASNAGQATYALVEEIIDANTVVLRSGGIIEDLQASAFAGGVINVGNVYYVSDTAGLLTDTSVAEERVALLVLTPTTGLVLVRAGGAGGEFVDRSGDTMSGDLTIEKGTPAFILQHTGNDHQLHTQANGSAYVRAIHDDLGAFLSAVETVRMAGTDVEAVDWETVLGVVASLDYVDADDLPTDASVVTRVRGDLRYSTTSGDTFPAAPRENALHYLTVDPVGMYIFYDDGLGGGPEWVPAGTSTTSGDTFPATPRVNDLHYLTVDTIGLYIFQDNGVTAEWVQTNGKAPDPIGSWTGPVGWGSGLANGRVNDTPYDMQVIVSNNLTTNAVASVFVRDTNDVAANVAVLDVSNSTGRAVVNVTVPPQSLIYWTGTGSVTRAELRRG
jgi:hypothetical protein